MDVVLDKHGVPEHRSVLVSETLRFSKFMRLAVQNATNARNTSVTRVVLMGKVVIQRMFPTNMTQGSHQTY